MKEQILAIIIKHPKHFTRVILKDTELSQWVYDHSLINSSVFLEHIRSAVFQETNLCKYGNQMHIKRFNAGFVGCGASSKCACTRERISTSVAIAKSKTTSKQKEIANSKRAVSMIEKYGVAHNLQRADVMAKITQPKIPQPTHSMLSDKVWLKGEYVSKQRSLVDIGSELNVYYGTVGDYCRRHGFNIRQRSQYSLVELDVSNYIKSLGLEVVTNDRTSLGGLEIDILIPRINLGIEVNGLYWHSYHPAAGKEHIYKHQQKTDIAESKGITLLQITDWQWYNKPDIVKGIIGSKLMMNDRVHARKCVIREVTTADARVFFNSTHLSGFAASSNYYGLYVGNELIQCIATSPNRFKRDNSIEIVRFATKPGITVVGGLSKLIKHVGPTRITTYCDRDISTAAAYKTVGFTEVARTKPGYFWTDGTHVISRQRAQKRNMGKWLSNYDPAQSESVNMFNNHYRRYWNAGNIYLELIPSDKTLLNSTTP